MFGTIWGVGDGLMAEVGVAGVMFQLHLVGRKRPRRQQPAKRSENDAATAGRLT